MAAGDTPTLDDSAPATPHDETLPASSAATSAASLPTRDPARYRRGGEIARGGMGRIVAAEDLELGRRVAIKELLARSRVLEDRFDREVRITARLQHPGIIAVQEAGRWPDGSAFYTMQHVEGRPLRDAIADARTLNERIALVPHVIAVADALAYAHGRQVIHRDLKPSNILVGAFGETIVIDWGLAKHIADADVPSLPGGGEGDGVTVLGEAIGTPSYMPPEQARGERVDARADVYAIGAILYHVLAQRPPYGDSSSSASEVVERVLAGPPAPLDDDAPADLRAIVAKAMSRDPADRYPTAAELAADLRRFSNGQLVGAHRYSIRQLLGRWILRHRAVVAVGTAATLALGVVAVIAVQRIREQRDVAAAERRAAEHHRAEVEGLLDFMLGDLHDKLEPIGKLDLLAIVADKASAYYGGQPIEDMTPVEARRRAQTSLQLGDVRVAAGDLPAGLASYRDAVLASARTDETSLQALAREKVGVALSRQGDLPGALVELREALALRRDASAKHPDDLEAKKSVAGALTRVGNVLRAQGDYAGALAVDREAVALTEDVVARDPEGRWVRDLAAGHNKVGDDLQAQEKLADALVEYRASAKLLEGLVARHPDDDVFVYHLSVVTDNVAQTLAMQGDMKGALAEYQKSVAIVRRLVERDPTNTEWQRGLSIGYIAVGDLQADAGDLTAALASFEQAHVIRARLAAQDATNTDWAHELTVALERIANIEREQGAFAAARRHYEDSLSGRAALLAKDPTNVRWEHDVWIAHYKVGTLEERSGNFDAARAAYQRAVDGAAKMLAAHPDDPTMKSEHEEIVAWLAGCCSKTRD
jgi:tetratricopeptide (TPR) repeat protein